VCAHSVMLRHLQEARARAREHGWGPVMSLIGQALRERMTNPWHLMYWIPTTEVNLVPLPANASFMVMTDPARELNPAQHKVLIDALGPGSDKQAEERLASGALLHVLFVDDMVAGTLFTVSGAARRFQHMVLTDGDSMVLDARIVPAFRGRGLYPVLLAHAAHALQAYGQDRLYIDTLETNTASLRSYAKVGFRFLTRYRMSWRRRYRFAEAPL
jgi:ribosomal protein S18 acetylase RimI-like enzyme